MEVDGLRTSLKVMKTILDAAGDFLFEGRSFFLAGDLEFGGFVSLLIDIFEVEMMPSAKL